MGAQMSSFINIQTGVESDLQQAVAYAGPVSVAVDASNKAFRVRVDESHPIFVCMPAYTSTGSVMLCDEWLKRGCKVMLTLV